MLRLNKRYILKLIEIKSMKKAWYLRKIERPVYSS